MSRSLLSTLEGVDPDRIGALVKGSVASPPPGPLPTDSGKAVVDVDTGVERFVYMEKSESEQAEEEEEAMLF